jgi:hypothetical protein
MQHHPASPVRSVQHSTGTDPKQNDTDITRPAASDDNTRIAAPGTALANEAQRKGIGRRYPASAFSGPLFETRDRIALAMAAVMLIGPLLALPLGF